MSNKIILKSINAVVVKNSSFDVKPWDGTAEGWNPADHEVFSSLIGQKGQSVQISDQKSIYKIAGKDGDLDHLPFGTAGNIVISFEPIN